MKKYISIFILIGLFMVILATGCTGPTKLDNTEFKYEIAESSTKTVAYLYRISSQTKDDSMFTWLYDFKKFAEDEKKKFQNYQVSPEFEPARLEYIAAMSDYYDFADKGELAITSGDTYYFSQATTSMQSGSAHIKSALAIIERIEGNSISPTIPATPIPSSVTTLTSADNQAFYDKAMSDAEWIDKTSWEKYENSISTGDFKSMQEISNQTILQFKKLVLNLELMPVTTDMTPIKQEIIAGINAQQNKYVISENLARYADAGELDKLNASFIQLNNAADVANSHFTKANDMFGKLNAQ